MVVIKVRAIPQLQPHLNIGEYIFIYLDVPCSRSVSHLVFFFFYNCKFEKKRFVHPGMSLNITQSNDLRVKVLLNNAII